MKIHRFKKVDKYKLRNIIAEELGIDKSHYGYFDLASRLDREGLYVESRGKKTSLIWRLTAPLFVVYIAFVILYLFTIGYIITGRASVNFNSPIQKTIDYWSKRI
ncbi:hypothetical protein AAU57_12040 [Nonlabens sp. YIK11]|uniref:hypothetical protein n=1 Tax=Nonlabens sp. YIK11 TaxID=1453349 RepID=UPI0006DD15BD|nr:hypothetical protein [Nonlabens sp. YIK11]KQC33978.1 hypothetical protein AAU57_12040 [Nonlabens sp. YIK11]